jgi:multicomponent Na+:H+ antiporter subunit D
VKYFILLPVLFPIFSGLFLRFVHPSKIKPIILFSVFLNLFFTISSVIFISNANIELFRFNELLYFYFSPDTIGKIFAVLVSVLWVFTTFYTLDYMSHESKLNTFYMFFTATQGITLAIAFSGNLITLYLFYELLTLITFPLVIQAESEEALKVGKKYLLYSFFGATFVLFGIVLLYSQFGNLDFVPNGIIKTINTGNESYYLMIYLFLFLGFGVKAALVPLHSWLPSAMVAPTPVSALLHAVAVVKSGIFSLLRITYYIIGWEIIEKVQGNKYTLILVFLTIVMGSFLAMTQKNLKKRLAYSTVSQLGYVMIGLVVFTPDTYIGGILHLLFHAFIKITLFFCIGAIMHYEHKTELEEIEGIGKRMPITMTCFSICSLCLIGIPPTNGFVSKWHLAIGGLQSGNFLVPVILLLSALFTAAYLIPIFSTAFFKGPLSKDSIVKEPGNFMLVPIVILTIINVLAGFFPNLIVYMVEKTALILF